MNLFRFLGDLSHLLAIILLLLKIWKSRSCAGESPSRGEGAGAGRPGAPGRLEPGRTEPSLLGIRVDLGSPEGQFPFLD